MLAHSAAGRLVALGVALMLVVGAVAGAAAAPPVRDPEGADTVPTPTPTRTPFPIATATATAATDVAAPPADHTRPKPTPRAFVRPQPTATPSPTPEPPLRLDEPVLRWLPEILAAAEATGVPAYLIAAVIRIESEGNPSVISAAGAVGLMQIMPVELYGQGLTPDVWHDPALNIMAGAIELVERAGTGWENAVAYYFGIGCDVYGTCTAAYVSAVLGWASYYGPILADPRNAGFAILPPDWLPPPIVPFVQEAPPLPTPPSTATPTATATATPSTTATPSATDIATETPPPTVEATPIPTEEPTVEPTTPPESTQEPTPEPPPPPTEEPPPPDPEGSPVG